MGDRIPSRPTKLQLLNIAFSFAVLTSLFYPPGKMIFYTFVDHAAFKGIPAYQQHLAHAFLNYWIPAILAYLALVLTPLGGWLKSKKSIHWSFFIANAIVVLYTIARILSSTVQGGGMGFLVASYAFVTALPAVLLILLSFVRMIILSIRFRSVGTDDEVQDWDLTVRGLDWALITIASAIPIIFSVYVGYSDGSPFQEVRASAPTFEERCKSAGDKVFSTRNGAKGILLNSDADAVFRKIKDGVSGSRGGGLLSWALLYVYDIQFMEIESRSSSPQGGTTVKYLRQDQSEPQKKYAVESPASEYGVFTKTITDEQEESIGITGRKTEIIDLRTHEVVASSVYFTSRADWGFCGSAYDGTYSTSAFIIRSLNLKPIKK